MEKINIILADDHALVRDGIKSLLEDETDVQVIGEAANGLEALTAIGEHEPDLLIVDIRMPEMNGIQVVEKVTRDFPEVRTLVLSMHDSEEYVVQSINAGADGYILKGASKDEFMKALHTVASGQKYYAGDVSSFIIKNFVQGTPVSPLKSVVTTDIKLTRREKQILDLVLEGLSNKDIAEKLNISKRTAEVHRFNLMKKMDVKNQMELANKAREAGL
ncbi:response regulator [Robertkochia solimangrovi]|uniref:response regulator n=1 Tax=Robertkochia solimangrovi TaxID=2213046 RepID=UPI00117D8E92|nr:response regulator transcription factor [Robertkochia solimangrovi]TRZ42284.1 DNA-binding response regulator [Robertkochia solimangrovi]